MGFTASALGGFGSAPGEALDVHRREHRADDGGGEDVDAGAVQ